jgi:predicted nucleic acid-binding protein
MIVVADTSPLRYLFLIGEIRLLPLLYRQIYIPTEVAAELTNPHSPPGLASWMENPPHWLEVRTAQSTQRPELAHLDSGEREAIELALECNIDTVLIDELKGRRSAEALNLNVRGTIGYSFRERASA